MLILTIFSHLVLYPRQEDTHCINQDVRTQFVKTFSLIELFIWNALPLKVNFSSLSALKGALNNVDFSSYLK